MREISLKLPVRYDHSSSLLIEADGGPIADCLTNHEIGEQIAAALNAHEQLAEAKAILIRIQDIHCGGADDPTILEDVDALRRKITRTLNGTDTAEEIQF